MSYITVCTPTYNRAHLLERPFKSLQNQTFKNFEWLIIDDGSNDNTKEVVQEFISQAQFPIKYVYKPNGGRHTALNLSYKYIKTKYVVNLDSDDSFTPDALQLMHDIWENMSKEDYDRFWCISGRCISSTDKKMIGKVWPYGINNLKGYKQHREITKIRGEMSCCRKTEVLKKFPFPEFSDTKYVPESMVWEQINQSYDQYCTNKIFRIYYDDSANSLAKGKVHNSSRKSSFYYFSRFYINDCFSQVLYNPRVIFSIVNISRCAILSNRDFKQVMNDINKNYKKILVMLGYPISWIWIKIYGKKGISK